MPEETSRPDWESARATIAVPGAPPPLDGTKWDKEAPTGPPTPEKREIPKHLSGIFRFFNGVIMDESLLIDLCLERCMEIVRRNVESKIVGSDHWAGDGQAGGGPYTPAHYAAVAGPLTVELYKQVLLAIDGRKEEYDKLVEEMNREREKNSPGGPRIIVPGA
jgi:hypothetical protein